MPKADFFSVLTAAISENRLTPYLTSNPNSQSEAYGTYLWNIALCESLYPALNCLEISLRNSIHDAAVQEFGVDDWFKSHLHLNELEPLNKLVNEMRQSRRSVGVNDLIANLTLGFWLSLFRSRSFGQNCWNQYFPIGQRSNERAEMPMPALTTSAASATVSSITNQSGNGKTWSLSTP